MNPATIFEIIDILDDIHTKLMSLKQMIGLGIVVRRNWSTKEKIKRGMGLNKDKFEGLPMED